MNEFWRALRVISNDARNIVLAGCVADGSQAEIVRGFSTLTGEDIEHSSIGNFLAFSERNGVVQRAVIQSGHARRTSFRLTAFGERVARLSAFSVAWAYERDMLLLNVLGSTHGTSTPTAAVRFHALERMDRTYAGFGDAWRKKRFVREGVGRHLEDLVALGLVETKVFMPVADVGFLARTDAIPPQRQAYLDVFAVIKGAPGIVRADIVARTGYGDAYVKQILLGLRTAGAITSDTQTPHQVARATEKGMMVRETLIEPIKGYWNGDQSAIEAAVRRYERDRGAYASKVYARYREEFPDCTRTPLAEWERRIRDALAEGPKTQIDLSEELGLARPTLNAYLWRMKKRNAVGMQRQPRKMPALYMLRQE